VIGKLSLGGRRLNRSGDIFRCHSQSIVAEGGKTGNREQGIGRVKNLYLEGEVFCTKLGYLGSGLGGFGVVLG
jgi:hypothetical protein